MSMILSSFSAALYQAADRNTLAQSAEAVAGTKQAFAETDQGADHGGRRHGQDSSETSPTAQAEDTTTTSVTDNHRHVLNVTA